MDYFFLMTFLALSALLLVGLINPRLVFLNRRQWATRLEAVALSGLVKVGSLVNMAATTPAGVKVVDPAPPVASSVKTR